MAHDAPTALNLPMVDPLPEVTQKYFDVCQQKLGMVPNVLRAYAFDIDKLRPAVFTLIALEEPENSLSPHYLGRVVRALEEFAGGQDAQAVLATHSPSLMRRVPPEAVRYMRLDEKRTTVVRHIELPEEAEAHKFVREAVQAFPELYFSRFVVLGEGDSEEVVLPRLLAAEGILADDASIS